MTAEVFAKRNHEKFIPLLRTGSWGEAAPSWLSGNYYVDLRGEPYREGEYLRLLNALHRRKQVPPLGPLPETEEPPQGRRVSWWLVAFIAALIGLIGWVGTVGTNVGTRTQQPTGNQAAVQPTPTNELPNNLRKRTNIDEREANGKR